jgi:hypothetical protein
MNVQNLQIFRVFQSLYVANNFINMPTCAVCSSVHVSVFNKTKKHPVSIITQATIKSTATSGKLQLPELSTDKMSLPFCWKKDTEHNFSSAETADVTPEEDTLAAHGLNVCTNRRKFKE